MSRNNKNNNNKNNSNDNLNNIIKIKKEVNLSHKNEKKIASGFSSTIMECEIEGGKEVILKLLDLSKNRLIYEFQNEISTFEFVLFSFLFLLIYYLILFY